MRSPTNSQIVSVIVQVPIKPDSLHIARGTTQFKLTGTIGVDCTVKEFSSERHPSFVDDQGLEWSEGQLVAHVRGADATGRSVSKALTQDATLRLLRDIVSNVRHGRMGSVLDGQLSQAEALVARMGDKS
jgi:hypothetical protein